MLKKTRVLTVSDETTKTKKIMRDNWNPAFKCTFKVLYPNNHYDICTTWFTAINRVTARRQAKKYLKENYGNNFKILSISY